MRGAGDTPVIPHLYEESGPEFVSRLEGMFAIALWDAGRERLVLARDRVGKKPLLWTRLPDGTLAFASELKALLRLPALRREVDPEQLDAYLALQYVPPGTALRGVEKLPPGHLLVAENGSVRVERYWSLEPQEERLDEVEWLERVRETVGEAVRRRLVADVPLGALLSGGIDSSIVVAEMARAGGRVRTFTVGFGDERYDERAYARAVAERYGTDHEEIVVEPDVTELLPRLARAFDEPLGDEAALPEFVVSELARQRVTVALTGDGGDEAFAGYERYAAVGLADRVSVPGVGTAARLLRWAGRREPRSRANRAGRLLELGALPAAERYGRLMEVFPAELRAELWEPEFVAQAATRLGAARASRGRHRRPAAPRRAHLPSRRPPAEGGHRLDGSLPRTAVAAARPCGTGARRVAAAVAEGRRPARQGGAATRLRGRPSAGGRQSRQDRLRRPDRPVVPR